MLSFVAAFIAFLIIVGLGMGFMWFIATFDIEVSITRKPTLHGRRRVQN